MFKKTKVCKGLMLAFAGSLALTGLPALAQQATTTLDRVEITGSAIKRLDAETALPITTIKMDDLKKEGVVTVEQAVNLIVANQSNVGTAAAVGSATGGAAFADLRGLGQNKTLVLLNGRRVANNAVDGSAVDLNMIPFAAIERVEVLRDGASSLYGTDAIGGVINFITRKDFAGGTLTLGADSPQHPGGKAYNVNAGYGFGDLAKDKYNIWGFVDYQKQDAIAASQRPFGSTGYIPSRGLSKSSGTPDPANYYQLSADGTTASPGANPSAPGCNAPWGFNLSGAKCRYDYTRWVDLLPQTERGSAMLNGTFAVSNDAQLHAEYFITQSKVWTHIAPVPYAALTMNPGTPFFPGNGITPAPTNFTIDPTLPIDVQWRSVAAGPRSDESKNTQQRFLLALDGLAAGWDYSTAFAYNQNKANNNLTGGYADGAIITSGVADGTINPFGDQTAAGSAMLNNALVKGQLWYSTGTVSSLDGHASRELSDWFGAGRATALALGAEFRREDFSLKANVPVAEQVISSSGYDPATDSHGSRDVYAVYGELNMPITKTLEATLAVRYDHYSDFGSTTNPKASFRYQPMSQLLFRGSAGTGFRAPSLYEINAPQTYTNTANPWDDPLAGCDANGVPHNPGFLPTSCGQQFMSLSGGNKALKPEKSKNYTLGLVVQPVNDLSAGLDFWWIRMTDQIAALPDTTIFGDTTKYANLFIRNAAGQLSIDGSQCPGVNCGYVLDTITNLGGVNTNGIDLSIAYRLRTQEAGTYNFTLNSTYITKYEYQNESGGPWIHNVGIYSGAGPVFRYQQTFNLQWTYGAFGLGLANAYKTGYFDQNDPNQVGACCQQNKVGSYSLWDINGSWAPTKNLSLLLGVRNLFDTNPPFSNQGATFQVGYDPRFTNPTGRAYYLRGTYLF